MHACVHLCINQKNMYVWMIGLVGCLFVSVFVGLSVYISVHEHMCVCVNVNVCCYVCADVYVHVYAFAFVCAHTSACHKNVLYALGCECVYT